MYTGWKKETSVGHGYDYQELIFPTLIIHLSVCHRKLNPDSL